MDELAECLPDNADETFLESMVIRTVLNHFLKELPAEARRLFVQRVTIRYTVTSVPDEFPGAEAIGKVELVYRMDSQEEFFMPYYKFYVRLDESHDIEELNLVTYGTYYVPAVSGEYINNMSRWDGSLH